MPEDTADLISMLQRQEEELVLDSFDHADAWTLGVGLVELAQAAGHAVGIDIRRPGLILFRAALAGVTPDQDSWIARKAALVLRMESSSALVDARLSATGVDAAASAGWVPSTPSPGDRFRCGSAASASSRPSPCPACRPERTTTLPSKASAAT